MRPDFLLLLACPVLTVAQTSIAVEVRQISEVLITQERRAPADVQPINLALVAAEVSAVISKINVDVGQRVKAGDILVQLDATDYELLLLQAEAGLEAAQAQKAHAKARLKRARDLGARDFVSADELLARETDLLVADAQINIQHANVANTRRQLDKCVLRAAFNGVVSERFAQLGSYVSPGSRLVELVETDRYKVDAEIPGNKAQSLAHSKDIRYFGLNESWPVKLLRLSPVINPERRTRRARLAFSDTAAPVGSSGELVWLVANALLPSSLIVQRDGQLGVFLYNAGTAQFMPLPTAQEGRPVVADLPGDSRVVVRGRDRLQDLDAISIGN